MKDDILTVLDPVNKIYEQREITDDVEKQLKTVTSGMDNILEIGQMDIKYEKGTVKLDGMEYDTEEVVNGDSTIKFVYNDEGKLVYVIRMDGTTETDIKITAFDGDVKESQFDIPDGYTSTSEADTSISSTSTEKIIRAVILLQRKTIRLVAIQQGLRIKKLSMRKADILLKQQIITL